MDFAKIIIGLLAFFVAWVFLFRTGFIFKINSWIRNVVFSDKTVLFSRRRLAILLFILGGLALFSGIEGMIDTQTIKPRIAADILERAQEDFQKKAYEKAIIRAKTLIHSEPDHVEAWKLLAESWWTIGDKEQALSAYETIIRLRPNFVISEHPILMLIYQEKNKTN